MKVAQYKGYDLASTCATFSIYKRNTGRALLSDAAAAKKVVPVIENLKNAEEKGKRYELTDEEAKLINDIDICCIYTELYVAFRQSTPEGSHKQRFDIMSEIDMDDISDPEFCEAMTKLLESKKLQGELVGRK